LSKESKLDQLHSFLVDIEDEVLNSEDQQGLTALAMAAKQGKADVCSLLIEHGANVRCSDEEGNSPLHHFATRGNLEMVKLLVDRGAGVDEQNQDGESALDWSRHQPLCAALLMTHGATLPVDDFKRADLLSFFGGNWFATLVLVKKFDFDITVIDSSGTSALHELVAKNRLAVVQKLTNLGANPHLQDSRGESAISIASKNGFTNISAFFLAWHENQKRDHNKVRIGERIDGRTSGFPAICDATYTIGGVEEEVVVKILMVMNDAERRVLGREAKILLKKVRISNSKELEN
jgi:ankyrin repeat protein